MADSFNDERIANELKRFGETIKLPIDRKKRPILIKKLNHYYARENPPLKKGKASSRAQRFAPKPATAEFSDDSQDETETRPERGKGRIGRNSLANNSFNRASPRRLRGRDIANGANSNTSEDNLRFRGGTSRNKPVSEIYPNEFSDNDTADESVYEVEEQSIGINTTLNYDDGDDTLDEEDFKPGYMTRKSGPKRRKYDNNISTISQANTSSNHISYDRTKSGGSSESVDPSERGHFISKTILTVVGIFFITLGLGYLYVRRDLFLPKEAASSQTDLMGFIFKEGQIEYNYTIKEINNGALPVINQLHEELAGRKGKYQLGKIQQSEIRMPRKEVEGYVNKSIWIKEKHEGEKEEEKMKLLILCLALIIKYPEWDLLAYDQYGSEANTVEEVSMLESVHGDLPLSQRIILALYKVLYGLCLLVLCVFVGVLGIFYLRWQNKRKEKAQQKVYDMVEKIIEMLKDNFELAERKNDNKNYPPYMAVQHIRDQLIPVSKRRQMQSLWDDAVEFIESNESRIRVETQVIQGEEFTVWRWLQAMPNGHKMWQGQAFGETSQGSVNSLPYGPTPCLKVRNMFDANTEQNVDDWHLDIEESVLEKCKDNHGILHIFVDRTSREGCVYIKCISCEKAYEAYQALHGWWFDGRLVTVKYLRLEHYHDRFPDSRNKRYPLKPSKSEMPSVSRPYHRSALEMT
ncbi:inner nuclear membrane protein Man1-like [Mercenaria mercenaria]|uniref:inner nuclear membrane protein Man1-like n=1 Tax=Mercenaria mercenaria TaxID=6596 RepID=UPI00234E4597|nr:inner nuclear membrane protein Man1-like [Mercenaria mercenaria]